jgi:hypothetical protein
LNAGLPGARNGRSLHLNRQQSGGLLVQSAQPPGGVFDCVDRLLEDDLLSRVLEALAGEPAPMG